ncbi:MAG: gamma-glutamyltransferase [Gammaproteobacteria bacterium]|nr:gamma-glutamyltransferase [Gammaproteobacteria bacterium]NIP88916.1 gamma-glutamyltransferase [Gammaproteobacteria bacterium]NIR23837.1 gamma-glutamyltransferase [Gammaproteobacteria bacterium]NIS05286.1 gamma-glutamyltransferase [Gammaproteobacteria bacterium]NIU42701.1 gamma-glutamyltransferase [Gammaproteobacteria bacterium]
MRANPAASARGRRPLALGLVAVLLLIVGAPSSARDTGGVSSRDVFRPVHARHGMVSTQEARATRIGVDILERGGNAVDAAVAIGFALAVTLPRAGNLGGGGFMMVHMARSGETVAIDYREMAPAGANRDMYLDAEGEVDKQRARFSHLSVGVPGTVAGLAMALEKFGTMSLAEVMAPAIALARDGITVSQQMADALERRSKRLGRHPATARIFFNADGTPLAAGERLVQSDLAWSLTRISEQGPGAFYGGEIAELIAAEMAANGGLITKEDLKSYRAVLRTPVHGTYRGYDVYSMPPPSSGGVHVIQLLNILEDYPIAFLGHNSADTIHLMAEAMKLAYADRSRYLGDPDFAEVPVSGLTSKAYAARLRASISLDRATPSTRIEPGDPLPFESNETTHYSIMDRNGNVVSNTYTLNFSYGTGIVAAGTGILLNNEMDDFSAKPGVPNAFGLIGGEANAIEPGKRPLSSMSPAIVFKDGKPRFATGTPGGSRIITTTLQIIMNVVDHGMNIAAATAAPRIHHQWLPDELRVEVGISPDTLDLLSVRGHRVKVGNAMGSTQTVMRIDTGFLGAADPRRAGALAQGH